MKSVVLLIAIVGTLSCPAAPASSLTGRGYDLLSDCRGPPEREGTCLGFIAGVYAATDGDLFCGPAAGIQLGQMEEIFFRWAQHHPELLHRSPMSSVVSAMREVYPCKPKPAPFAAQSADGVMHVFPNGTTPTVIDQVMKAYAAALHHLTEPDTPPDEMLPTTRR